MAMSSDSPPSFDDGKEGGTTRHMIRGASWAVLMRWGIRVIGIFNLVILARLLTPQELGVVALASLIIGLIRQFYQIGIPMLLIRKQQIDRAHCDTAWSLKLCMGGVMAVVMMASAPLMANFFGEPRMVNVTYVLALAFFITSGVNVGMVLARRELDFAKDFRFNVYVRFITFVVTIGLALWLRNVWAVVYGTLCGAVFEVLLSFGMHKYRPRFDLSRHKEYVRFGLSIVPLNIGQYLVQKTDAWVVAGIAPTEKFAAYNMGSELSVTFTQEIVGTVGRGLYPNFTRLVDRPAELSAAFSNVLCSVCLLVLPLGVGLALVSKDAVAVLLGSQWSAVIPLLPWLSVYWAIAAIIALMTGQILIAIGRERLSAAMTWVRLAIMAPIAILAGQLGGVEGVAQGILLSAVISFPIAVGVLVRTSLISVRQFLHAIWRPTTAVLIMAAGVSFAHLEFSDIVVLRLLLDIIFGGAIYVSSVVVIWFLAGRPEGPESALIGFISRLFRSGTSA